MTWLSNSISKVAIILAGAGLLFGINVGVHAAMEKDNKTTVHQLANTKYVWSSSRYHKRYYRYGYRPYHYGYRNYRIGYYNYYYPRYYRWRYYHRPYYYPRYYRRPGYYYRKPGVSVQFGF